MSSCACISDRKKLLISAQTSLIAFVIFNPILFQAVSGLLGRWVASADGLPTTIGLFLHVILFGLIIFLLMKPYKQTSKKLHQSVQSLPLV